MSAFFPVYWVAYVKGGRLASLLAGPFVDYDDAQTWIDNSDHREYPTSVRIVQSKVLAEEI